LEDSIHSDPDLDLQSGDELCFAQPGVRHGVLKKLKRGQYAVMAVLDLHGLFVREAHELLIDFIQTNRAAGHQCVRIIHGKGRRSPHGRPVLKNKIFNWLQHRDEVLAFCSARRNDGGTGAIYVLLKRSF
jgi:DNA-nicking Smr family endonuclease